MKRCEAGSAGSTGLTGPVLIAGWFRHRTSPQPAQFHRPHRAGPHCRPRHAVDKPWWSEFHRPHRAGPHCRTEIGFGSSGAWRFHRPHGAGPHCRVSLVEVSAAGGWRFHRPHRAGPHCRLAFRGVRPQVTPVPPASPGRSSLQVALAVVAGPLIKFHRPYRAGPHCRRCPPNLCQRHRTRFHRPHRASPHCSCPSTPSDHRSVASSTGLTEPVLIAAERAWLCNLHDVEFHRLTGTVLIAAPSVSVMWSSVISPAFWMSVCSAILSRSKTRLRAVTWCFDAGSSSALGPSRDAAVAALPVNAVLDRLACGAGSI